MIIEMIYQEEEVDQVEVVEGTKISFIVRTL